MSFNVRNGAGWLSNPTTKVRNASNTAWITVSSSNGKIRNAANNGWITFAGTGGGGATITGMTASALTTIMDVSTNGNHQLLGGTTAYGLWPDGFPHPYRDGAGNTYLPIPHSENYRFLVNSWDSGAGWTLQGPTLTSARDVSEGSYNNRHWVFGVWASGNTIRGLAHHEWYKDMTSAGGVGGFNAALAGFNRRWVNAVTWVSSTDGGATFSPNSFNDSRRCVLIPEPWSNQSRDHMYGFFHPTNIVQEGAYFYAAVEQRSLSAAGAIPENGGAAGFCADSGVSLIRTADLSSSTGWQYWDGSSWTTVNHSTYQGNGGPQVPHRFFPSTNHNFYENPNNFTSGMGHCLRYHPASGKWVMFGFNGYMSGGSMGYTTTSSLANPSFSAITPVAGTATDDYSAPSGMYFGVFDPAATDQNFVNIGNTCVVLVARDGARIRKGTLTINVT